MLRMAKNKKIADRSLVQMLAMPVVVLAVLMRNKSKKERREMMIKMVGGKHKYYKMHKQVREDRIRQRWLVLQQIHLTLWVNRKLISWTKNSSNTTT